MSCVLPDSRIGLEYDPSSLSCEPLGNGGSQLSRTISILTAIAVVAAIVAVATLPALAQQPGPTTLTATGVLGQPFTKAKTPSPSIL